MTFIIFTSFALASVIGACVYAFSGDARCKIFVIDLVLLLLFSNLVRIPESKCAKPRDERFHSRAVSEAFPSDFCDGGSAGSLSYLNELALIKYNETHIITAFRYSTLVVDGVCTDVYGVFAYCFEKVDQDMSYCLDKPYHTPQEHMPFESWYGNGRIRLLVYKHLYLLVAKTFYFFGIDAQHETLI